jgi:hypothetical protein
VYVEGCSACACTCTWNLRASVCTVSEVQGDANPHLGKRLGRRSTRSTRSENSNSAAEMRACAEHSHQRQTHSKSVVICLALRNNNALAMSTLPRQTTTGTCSTSLAHYDIHTVPAHSVRCPFECETFRSTSHACFGGRSATETMQSMLHRS